MSNEDESRKNERATSIRVSSGIKQAYVRFTSAVVFALALAIVTPAAAQDASAADRADKLFSEANTLAEKGNYADACPKFEESLKLEPAINTQYNLAVCYEKLGKLGAAYRNFRAVERLAHASGKKSREDAARQKLAALGPKVTHVTLVTQDPDLTLKLDGERVEPEEWSFVALDSGAHTVEASAPTKKPWRGSVAVIEQGGEVRLEIPKLVVDTRVVTVTKEVSTKRTIGYVVGGVGIVGLGVAAVTGLLIMDAKATADDKCKLQCVDQDGRDAVARGDTLLPINAVAAAVGVVGLGAGAFLILTSSKKPATTANVTMQPYAGIGGVGLSGVF